MKSWLVIRSLLFLLFVLFKLLMKFFMFLFKLFDEIEFMCKIFISFKVVFFFVLREVIVSVISKFVGE